MDKFSDILSDLIIENNCSLREMERRCGVASSQLSRYLKGTIPNVKVAMTLANYFECGLDYLFGLSDEKQNIFYANFDTYNFINPNRIVICTNIDNMFKSDLTLFEKYIDKI